MKITDKPPVQTPPPKQVPRPRPAKEADFAQTLARAQKSAPGLAGPGAPASPGEVSPVSQVLAANMSGPAARVEQALGLLESYSQALADPGRTLKQIAPLVKDLEKEAAALTSLGRDLPPDHALRGLLDRTAILALVEAAKFNRGDYV